MEPLTNAVFSLYFLTPATISKEAILFYFTWLCSLRKPSCVYLLWLAINLFSSLGTQQQSLLQGITNNSRDNNLGKKNRISITIEKSLLRQRVQNLAHSAQFCTHSFITIYYIQTKSLELRLINDTPATTLNTDLFKVTWPFLRSIYAVIAAKAAVAIGPKEDSAQDFSSFSWAFCRSFWFPFCCILDSFRLTRICHHGR